MARKKPVEYTKFERSLVDQQKYMRAPSYNELMKPEERIAGCWCDEERSTYVLNRSHLGTPAHLCNQLGIDERVDRQLKQYVRNNGGRVKHRSFFQMLVMHENLLGRVNITDCRKLYAIWSKEQRAK